MTISNNSIIIKKNNYNNNNYYLYANILLSLEVVVCLSPSNCITMWFG